MFEFLYATDVQGQKLEVLRAEEEVLLARLNEVRLQQLCIEQKKSTQRHEIDFGRRYISSEDIDQYLQAIIDEVRPRVQERKWIILFMDENYLKAADIKKLLELIQLPNEVGAALRMRLRYLDLENNRISGKEGFDLVKALMKVCPNVDVNLAVNLEDRQYTVGEEDLASRFKKYRRLQ